MNEEDPEGDRATQVQKTEEEEEEEEGASHGVDMRDPPRHVAGASTAPQSRGGEESLFRG